MMTMLCGASRLVEYRGIPEIFSALRSINIHNASQMPTMLLQVDRFGRQFNYNRKAGVQGRAEVFTGEDGGL